MMRFVLLALLLLARSPPMLLPVLLRLFVLTGVREDVWTPGWIAEEDETGGGLMSQHPPATARYGGGGSKACGGIIPLISEGDVIPGFPVVK